MAMIISAVIIISYTCLGGFLAASFTDLIQSIVMTSAGSMYAIDHQHHQSRSHNDALDQVGKACRQKAAQTGVTGIGTISTC